MRRRYWRSSPCTFACTGSGSGCAVCAPTGSEGTRMEVFLECAHRWAPYIFCAKSWLKPCNPRALPCLFLGNKRVRALHGQRPGKQMPLGCSHSHDSIFSLALKLNAFRDCPYRTSIRGNTRTIFYQLGPDSILAWVVRTAAGKTPPATSLG